ncbi:hypothetical protein [Nitrincola sp. MINF-07-Sa-05]|uniref:hypothetical protein n=1 Tax=Nitrincola salilacus TaxID=3400273 RepID=UPI003917FFC6
MKLDYLLTGVIAGSYIEITGKGEIDQALGAFNLELEAVPPCQSSCPVFFSQ